MPSHACVSARNGHQIWVHGVLSAVPWSTPAEIRSPIVSEKNKAGSSLHGIQLFACKCCLEM